MRLHFTLKGDQTDVKVFVLQIKHLWNMYINPSLLHVCLRSLQCLENVKILEYIVRQQCKAFFLTRLMWQMSSSLEYFNSFSDLQQEVKRHPIVPPVYLRDRYQDDWLQELEPSLQQRSSSFWSLGRAGLGWLTTSLKSITFTQSICQDSATRHLQIADHDKYRMFPASVSVFRLVEVSRKMICIQYSCFSPCHTLFCFKYSSKFLTTS